MDCPRLSVDRLFYLQKRAFGERAFWPCPFNQDAEELLLDLARSIIIGDALTDMFPAKAAGIGRLGLVLAGWGAAQALLYEAISFQSLPIYDDLMVALSDQRLIIES